MHWKEKEIKKEIEELIEKKMELFIEKNRRGEGRWESAYHGGKYCIGEDDIRKFVYDFCYTLNHEISFFS